MSDTTETTSSTEDTSGLKAKNTELLRKLKEAEARAKQAEDDAAQAAEDATSANASELDKARNAIKRLEKDLEAANKSAADNAQALRTTRADHAISKAIAEANVDAKHVRAATALLKLDMAFDDEGNATIDGKNVADYAKDYFSKDGLAYVRAADNSGGTSNGNTSTKPASKLSGRPTTSAEWDALDAMEKSERNAFADSIGAPDLKV